MKRIDSLSPTLLITLASTAWVPDGPWLLLVAVVTFISTSGILLVLGSIHLGKAKRAAYLDIDVAAYGVGVLPKTATASEAYSSYKDGLGWYVTAAAESSDQNDLHFRVFPDLPSAWAGKKGIPYKKEKKVDD